MPDIILHHYSRSPFAEKVRLALGLKGLDYFSVTIPVWMPKPDLVPLTGGYRRTPVMQVGADVFCDTLAILGQIERMHPSPSLFPGGTGAAASALGWGMERSLFPAAVGIVIGLKGHAYPPALLQDRLGFFGFSIDPAAMLAKQALFADRLNAQLGLLAGMMDDGRDFLLGAAPSAADLGAYHPLWHLRQNGGEMAAALLPAMRTLLPWMDRIAAQGHGRPQELAAADALAIAAASSPTALEDTGAAGLTGVALGDEVGVTPDDAGRDTVTGRLVAVSATTIVLRRVDAALGEINVHFPRVGFDVTRGSSTSPT